MFGHSTFGKISFAQTDSVALNSYTLSVTAATYVVTPQTAGLHKGYRLSELAATYSVISQTVSFVHGFGLIASSATYLVTGLNAPFERFSNPKRLSPITRTYTVNGGVNAPSVTLRTGKSLLATSALFSVSPKTITLRVVRNLTVSGVTYTVTPEATTGIVGTFITVDDAITASNEQPINFNLEFVFGPTVATYAVNSQLSTNRATKFTSSFTSFVTTSSVARLTAARRLPPQTDTFSISTSISSALARRILTESNFSYSVTQFDVAILSGRNMPAFRGIYRVVPFNADLSASGQFLADPTIYKVDLFTSLVYSRTEPVDSATFIISATDLPLDATRQIPVSSSNVIIIPEPISESAIRYMLASEEAVDLSATATTEVVLRRLKTLNVKYNAKLEFAPLFVHRVAPIIRRRTAYVPNQDRIVYIEM